jgi:DNA/RNA-binding domain of Phe-tRNA-synthetase-like protein
MLSISDTWKTTYPEAFVGLLAMEKVVNPQRHPELEQHKTEVEAQLRSQFASLERADLKALPVLQAYNAYYKPFKKSYHVQAQVESVVWKGKTIPSVAALVEAMFMAELKNMLLTAGHDLEKLQLPVKIDVAAGDEHYLKMNG